MEWVQKRVRSERQREGEETSVSCKSLLNMQLLTISNQIQLGDSHDCHDTRFNQIKQAGMRHNSLVS